MKQSSENDIQNRPAGIKSFTSRLSAGMIILLAYVVGGFSLLAWVVFLFHGSLNLINLELGKTARLGLDALLCLLFFIQHSTMLRSSFREWLATWIKADFHGAVFTVFSGLFLLLQVVFWQASDPLIIGLHGPFRWVMRLVFFLSILGFNLGTRALGSFDALGVKPVLQYLRGAESLPSLAFTVRGPYRWVRHPLYFFCLLMIWSHPDLTVDRLLFNCLWTVWITIGSILEERDLVTSFGEEYRDYQRKVPMLIPRSIYPIQ